MNSHIYVSRVSRKVEENLEGIELQDDKQGHLDLREEEKEFLGVRYLL